MKSDFNPSIPGKGMSTAPHTTSTTACNRVIKFVNYQVDKIKESLDGKNIEFVLYELGVRLHWVIYQHMQQFTYSSDGVMNVMMDVQVNHIQCVTTEFRQGPVYVVNFQFSRCLDGC